MVLGGISTSTQVVNLSFKLAGVEEELAAVKAITIAIQVAIAAMAVLRIAAIGLAAAGPLGILVAGALILGTGVTISNSFTQTEVTNARGN